MSVMNRPLFRANGGSVNGDRRREIVDEINRLDRLVADEVISQARADFDRQLLRDEMMEIPLSESEKRNLARGISEYFKDVGKKGRESTKDRARGPRIRIEELAKGGAANGFPDLSGDGKITQKDILMGRGVISKQEGGPIMPQEAAGQVQMASEAEGQQVGLDYVAKTLGGIDNAEDVESMINAIRGNDMPIEARRTELAEFVGRDDAMATPESVLAMVQPTIMLSEEGAMNSGIGDLMQNITADIEMATEGGEPTDMGQGVGALMMAGAPMDAAPQQFANGGAVQPVYMADAGDASLEQILQLIGGTAGPTPGKSVSLQGAYDEYLPLYQNLVSQSDEDRRKDRALALAKAGFQFASGRDASGKNIAGQPFLSQLGSAATGLVGDLGELEKERRKSDLAVKTLAAQSAGKAVETARDTASARALAREKAQYDIVKEIVKAQFKDGSFEVSQIRTDRDGKPVFGIVNKQTGAVSAVDLTTPRGQATMQAAAETGSLTAQPQTDERTIGLPDSTPAERAFKTIMTNLNAYADGTLNPTDTQIFETSLETYYNPSVDPESGVVKFANPLTSQVANAITKRDEAEGLDVNLNVELLSKARKVGETSKQTAEERLAEINKDLAEITILPTDDFDAAESIGVRPVVQQALASGAALVRELTGSEILTDTETAQRGEKFRQTRQYLNKLGTITLKTLLSELGTRPLASVVETIQRQVDGITPSGFGDFDEEYLANLRVLRSEIAQKQKVLNAYVENPDLYPKKDVGTARELKPEADGLIQAYDQVIAGLETSLGIVEDKGITERPEAQPDSDGNIKSPAEQAIRGTMGMTGPGL